MKIYNTLARYTEDFVPLAGKKVGMYTCGPTVYNFAHIGNFRAYIFEDILRRHLKWSGYDVTQVMNLTDVDDKTIKGARDAGVSLKDYTAKYVESFFHDLETLNIERAEHYPAATDHVPEMIDLITRILDADYAYKSEDGSVYFNVEKFKFYGKLSHLDISGLRAGARVVHDEYDKENIADFVLWKAWQESDGDVAWDSPWGRGRPGWHIECSAMSIKYLGESFDIHTGGIDNMFPHHENEIAQSESATGKQFVKYWMHCGYLVVDGTKMSKSLGNFYTLQDLIDKGYSGRDVRYILFAAHYRQPLNFTFKALDSARSALGRLDEFRSRLQDLASTDVSGEKNADWAAKGREDFCAALDDDLNMPEALGALFNMVHVGNKEIDAGLVDSLVAATALSILDDMDSILGVFVDCKDEVDDQVNILVQARAEARNSKNWAESDRLRDAIAALGWEVRDTPDGQKLKRHGCTT
ncbi:MAG: cysteine--tRNA ligase [Kiritimatiellae bacterium]|nr:cysteine--tRNA ligase [Kiritimatiellia bacterium]